MLTAAIILVLAVSSSALRLDSRRTAVSKIIQTAGAVPAAAVAPSIAIADASSVGATQTSVALNSGSRFPLASFGLQVYDDNTGMRRGSTLSKGAGVM